MLLKDVGFATCNNYSTPVGTDLHHQRGYQRTPPATCWRRNTLLGVSLNIVVQPRSFCADRPTPFHAHSAGRTPLDKACCRPSLRFTLVWWLHPWGEVCRSRLRHCPFGCRAHGGNHTPIRIEPAVFLARW